MDHKEEHRDAQFLEEIESLREEIAAEQSGTNISRQESSASESAQAEADSSKTPTTEGQAEPAHAQAQEPENKDQGSEESLRSTLRELRNFTDDEDDAPAPSRKMTLASILGGDILTGGWFRRQFFYILMLVAMVVIYISNRYSCQQSLIEIDKLQKELLDAKYKAQATGNKLTELSRESNVLDMLKANNDSTLKMPTQPPYLITVPEK